MSLQRAIGELLTNLFTPRELSYFLEEGPDGENIIASLPISTSHLIQVREAVKALERFGRLDEAFFDRLLEERPGRETDIRETRHLWNLDAVSKQAEERVHAAERKADSTRVQVESQVSDLIREVESRSNRAKRIAQGAVAASLLVATVAVVTLINFRSLKADLEVVRQKAEEATRQAQKIVARIDEIKNIALTAQRLSERILTESEQTDLARRRVEEPEIFPPESENRPRMGGKLWPVGATLRVRFVDGTTEQHSQVKRLVQPWLEHANLKLDFVDGGDAEIRVEFDETTGAWSAVGTDALGLSKDSPTLNLGWVDSATVLHEFGHVLGLVHEHQNPNADIEWDKEVVIADLSGPPSYWRPKIVESVVLSRVDAEAYPDYREFDPNSVMMYSFASTWTRDGRGFVGNATELSDGDRAFVARLYPPL